MPATNFNLTRFGDGDDNDLRINHNLSATGSPATVNVTQSGDDGNDRLVA